MDLKVELEHNIFLRAYADDFLLISRGEWINNLTEQLNKALSTLLNWSRKYKLQFCPEKTKMIFYKLSMYFVKKDHFSFLSGMVDSCFFLSGMVKKIYIYRSKVITYRSVKSDQSMTSLHHLEHIIKPMRYSKGFVFIAEETRSQILKY